MCSVLTIHHTNNLNSPIIESILRNMISHVTIILTSLLRSNTQNERYIKCVWFCDLNCSCHQCLESISWWKYENPTYPWAFAVSLEVDFKWNKQNRLLTKSNDFIISFFYVDHFKVYYYRAKRKAFVHVQYKRIRTRKKCSLTALLSTHIQTLHFAFVLYANGALPELIDFFTRPCSC